MILCPSSILIGLRFKTFCPLMTRNIRIARILTDFGASIGICSRFMLIVLAFGLLNSSASGAQAVKLPSKQTSATIGKQQSIRHGWISHVSRGKVPIYVIKTYQKELKNYYIGSVQYPHLTTRSWLIHLLNQVIFDHAKGQVDDWAASQKVYLQLAPKQPYAYKSTIRSTFVSLSLVSIVNEVQIQTGDKNQAFLYDCDLYTRTGSHWFKNNLHQLFIKNVDYLKIISDLALPILKEKGASDVWSGLRMLSAEDCSQFSVNASKLNIYFAPLVLGPRSEGSFIVSLPLRSINGLDTNGPLRYLLKRLNYKNYENANTH